MENQKREMKIYFDGINKLEQIKMIEDIINKLGFDKIGDAKKIDRETFEKNIEIVKIKCQLFNNINKSQPMFGYDKIKIGKINTIKQFMGFANSLFNDWGFMIEFKRSYTSKIINNKKKNININYYMLTYINDIQKYI